MNVTRPSFWCPFSVWVSRIICSPLFTSFISSFKFHAYHMNETKIIISSVTTSPIRKAEHSLYEQFFNLIYQISFSGCLLRLHFYSSSFFLQYSPTYEMVSMHFKSIIAPTFLGYNVNIASICLSCFIIICSFFPF